MPQHLRVFLASPGDVPDERNLALKVLERLPYDPLLRGKVTLEVVAWDKAGAGTPMLATMTPQEAIAQGLPKPSECDLVIVIFWSRMGTLLPEEWVKPEAFRYLSGTEWAALDASYLSGAEWEYFDALQTAEKQDKPKILVYRRDEKRSFDPDEPAFNENVKQWRLVKAFFNGFRNPDGSIRRGYNKYQTPTEFEKDLENHLKSQINGIIESPPGDVVRPSPAASPPRPLWEGSPFPSLSPFTPDDAPIFFGRGRETDNLIGRLADPSTRFLAVIGASGSGKSSLVAAGLLPRLQSGAIEGSRDWRRFRFTPGESGDNPFMAVAAAFKPVLDAHGQRFGDAAKGLREDSETFGKLVDLALEGGPDWAELFLFIDQFEELFTLVGADYRGPFIDWLAGVAKLGRVRTVVTMRADFYHRCLRWEQLTELLETGSYPLKAPGLGALNEMITRPAERAGLAFEEGLAGRILDETGAEPGALALMAFALSELYKAREADGRLTWAAYKGFDGVPGAIAKRAEETFDGLGDEAQAALGHVFRELVDVDEQGVATRRRTPLNRVRASESAARLVSALTDARLLVASRAESKTPVLEVAHEALFRSWPRLKGWIESMADDLRLRRQITQLADYWSRHDRQDEHRWSDDRVVEVVKMLDHLGISAEDLPGLERDFLGPLDRRRMLVALDEPATSHATRAIIGARLSLLGDPRPGVGPRADGLPDIAWCKVPGGEIALEDEAGVFPVEPFYIAKYPVTYVQYHAFLEADDGFPNPDWWRGLTFERPDKLGRQFNRRDNHPAENLAWFDSVAFCRWLSAKLGYKIRLPTEWEWQQAATGGEREREYPWPGAWDSGRANTIESELSHSTAVDMYPQGASVVGALDMAGNVWELCRNEYDNPSRTALAGEARRVVRGGSWGNLLAYARAACRLVIPPRLPLLRRWVSVVVFGPHPCPPSTAQVN